MILVPLSRVIGNTPLEHLLSVLILISSLGGLVLGNALSLTGLISGEEIFFFGCISASCLMAVLAFKKPKFDVVSAITPLYAGIIFFGIGISPSLMLQVLYTGTLLVLLLRIHARFS